MQREITQEMAKDRLPRREADANKGSFGSVLVAAGSMAYRGAAALCTEGALRAGAGLVYLASVEPVVQMVLTRTPECCACGCRTAANGGIHPQDAGALRSWFDGKNTVLLAGPGLGESAAPVCNALLGKKSPLVRRCAGRRCPQRAGCGQNQRPFAGPDGHHAPPRRSRPPAGLHSGGGAG